ncbi:hypothetical protein AALP_AA3G205800 [Arabis alpina]|uniref:DUF4283 domain-containing protein n=1 Tax=Arabis alpina TaxID=50452 RepID=A0A087HAJ0_ARAAL|nr:hypothetical protein AALP_AA3G205800 [Arabis alpina]
MAFFGKLISSEKDIKKEQPIKLPPIDKNQVLKRFERTLVGRPLLREVQDNKLPAMIGFVPTVWRCEGRVQGFEMGDGRVHFRFQNEKDLLVVMENRPYHYDGSMIALERWVPTVRRDFPSTIPFWIIIKGLPDYRCEEDSVQSIGENLGEFMKVDVSEPIPKYEKLHKHCLRCFWLTHETPACPDRPREIQQSRDHRQEHVRRREENEGRGRQRSYREERRRVAAPPQVSCVGRAPADSSVASSSRPRPMRRDILAELESTSVEPEQGKSAEEAAVANAQWVAVDRAPRMEESRNPPEKSIEGHGQVARVSTESGVAEEDHGPENVEAHQADESYDSLEPGLEFQAVF